MKILIIHPNKLAERYVSLGVSMISAALKRAGHEIEFFDTSRFKRNARYKNEVRLEKSTTNMQKVLQFLPVEFPAIKKSNEDVVTALHSKLNQFLPELICFSVTSSEVMFFKSMVKEIKGYEIPIVVGGVHATVAPMDILGLDGVGQVVLGEAEEAIVELASSISAHDNKQDIKNVFFKNKTGVITNSLRPYVKNMDLLPFMDVDIFDEFHHLGAYQGRLVKYARFETSRGCPYNCSYCINETLHKNIYSDEKKHLRSKSPKRVIDELEYINNKIEYDIIRFVDETFLAHSLKWLKEFAAFYKAKINKPFIIATRPESVNHEKLSVIRRANDNIQITMGIESGSERIRRDVLNRKMSNELIIKAFHLCNEFGFLTAAFNMIGLPGETRTDFFETIQLNRDVNVQIPILSYFYPFPGCKLREYCITNKYIDDLNHEVDYSVSSVLKLPDFSFDEIEGLKRTFIMYVKMNKNFYKEINLAEKDNDCFNKLVKTYNRMNIGNARNY